MNFAWAFETGLALFYMLNRTVGLRVSVEEELLGLDIDEHDVIAYPGFVYAEAAKPLTVRPLKEGGKR